MQHLLPVGKAEAAPLAHEAHAGPESYPHLTPSGIEPQHPQQPWISRRD